MPKSADTNDDISIPRAVRLLESAGYRVIPPNAPNPSNAANPSPSPSPSPSPIGMALAEMRALLGVFRSAPIEQLRPTPDVGGMHPAASLLRRRGAALSMSERVAVKTEAADLMERPELAWLPWGVLGDAMAGGSG